MQSFSFTSAELAVLIDHMAGGRLMEGSTSLPELRVDRQALSEAEEDLLEQGSLVSLPFEEASGVTSQLASILSAALSPDRVCVVRTIHQDHTDRPVFFSLTPGCITINHVDEHGQYVFAELPDVDEAVSAIISAGGPAAPAKPTAKPASGVNGRAKALPRALAELLKEAQRLVVLMVVLDPAVPEFTARSLAWVETDSGLWVVDDTADGDTPLATSIALTSLRERITGLLEAKLK